MTSATATQIEVAEGVSAPPRDKAGVALGPEWLTAGRFSLLLFAVHHGCIPGGDFRRQNFSIGRDVSRDFHDDHIRWTADPAWYAPTGGEPAIAIARRALEVVEEIKQRYHSGNVLVVSHKATIRIVLASLLGIDVGRFRYRLGCPVASVSKVEFSLQGPLLHALADRTHLSAKLWSLPGT